MGMISDKTKIALAKMPGGSKEDNELDVAILKATIAREGEPPKEKHIRTLRLACAGSAPRRIVEHVIRGLFQRIEDKQGWLVTLKAVMVFHQLLREVDPTFQEELVKFSDRTGVHHPLRLDTYQDHTTKATWDCSAWIRVYSTYVDERLDCFRSIKFDPEQDAAAADERRESKWKHCSAAELLDQLPKLQKLLLRLVACVPEGAAAEDPVVIPGALWVLKESRAIYKCISEGVMNLADKFFEMDRADALRGLESYREVALLNDKLNAYYAVMQNNQNLRGSFTVPSLTSLPQDFLATMEEYVREQPKVFDSATAAVPKRGTAVPLPAARASTMLRANGTTAAVLGGTAGAASKPAPALPDLRALTVAEKSAPSQDLLGSLNSPVAAPQQPTPERELANVFSAGPETSQGNFDPFGGSMFGSGPVNVGSTAQVAAPAFQQQVSSFAYQVQVMPYVTQQAYPAAVPAQQSAFNPTPVVQSVQPIAYSHPPPSQPVQPMVYSHPPPTQPAQPVAYAHPAPTQQQPADASRSIPGGFDPFDSLAALTSNPPLDYTNSTFTAPSPAASTAYHSPGSAPPSWPVGPSPAYPSPEATSYPAAAPAPAVSNLFGQPPAFLPATTQAAVPAPAFQSVQVPPPATPIYGAPPVSVPPPAAPAAHIATGPAAVAQTATLKKKAQDPLAMLSDDLFGPKAAPPPPPSLKDIKAQQKNQFNPF